VKSRWVDALPIWTTGRYAIGQGASTQTVLGLAWMIAFGTEALGPPREVLMIGSWVLNLLIAEMLIHRFLRPKSKISLRDKPSKTMCSAPR